MRVGIDATPLLGRRTGIGTYVQHLTEGLLAMPVEERPDLVATAFTRAASAELADAVGPSLTQLSLRSRRIPAGILHRLWLTSGCPTAEFSVGRVDLFHGTNFVLPPLRRAAGVVTIHDLSFVRYPETVSAASRRYRALVPASLRGAAVVTTDSQAVADEIVDEYGFDAERIVVAPLGVDRSWARAVPLDAMARSRLGLPERYIVAVGTLEPRKNLKILVQAQRELLTRGAEALPLVFVGAAGWGATLEVADLPGDLVRFTGFLDSALLQRVVAGAAALAFPSRYEGFGLPPLEALACGIPALVSDLPVTREILGTMVTYLDAGDPEAWADALNTVALSSDTASAMRREYAAKWSWVTCVERTLAAYRQALT